MVMEIKMINVGIISEYNPMHKGHIYQIQQIRKSFSEQVRIICLMSGHFVQRGEMSIVDKFSKADFAIENGADLVLEMPTYISLQAAEFFSLASVFLMDKINIDYLSFGIESDIDDLNRIAKIENTYGNELRDFVKKSIKSGLSYKRAYIDFMDLKKIDFDFYTPNNTLALEYIKALNKLKSNIKCLPIKRKGAEYDRKLIKANSEYQSASAIRNLVSKGDFSFASYVPQNVFSYLQNINWKNFPPDRQLYDIFSYLIKSNRDRLELNPHFENGIRSLILKNINAATSCSGLADLLAGKKYSKTRIQRLIMCEILDAEKIPAEDLTSIDYIKPLSFNESGRSFLRSLKDKINIVNKPNKAKLDGISKKLFDLDIRADKVYRMFHDIKYDDFTHNPYRK